jgi:DNA invertase Pin-like site-specific DNA recombinase
MARPSVRAKLKGRQPSFTPKQDAAIAGHLKAGEFSAAEIAGMFKTSRASVYRAATRHHARTTASPLPHQVGPSGEQR